MLQGGRGKGKDERGAGATMGEENERLKRTVEMLREEIRRLELERQLDKAEIIRLRRMVEYYAEEEAE